MAMNEKHATKIALSSMAAAMLLLTGCGSSSSSSSSGPSCDSSVIDEVLPSVIDANMTLSAGSVYGMNGKVKVTDGAVLTIDPGATVAGCTQSSFMVIDAGSKIEAVGTMNDPIVFTSQKDVQGLSSSNAAGEWGGLVLAGNAYTHYGVASYEADETVEFGCDGSTVPCVNDQSSGTLQYVVIKHTGYEVEKDKELNGLSLAGVGSGTTISNVAIVGGLDDGLEIWGGRVNIDGLYVYNAQDDSVDTDLGYRGTIQNVLVQQVNVDKTNAFDSSTMEFGNDNNTISTDDTNATQPTIINATTYVKGGGFYTKNDAGANLDNVKFVSEKTTDVELHTFRTSDAYVTAAINAIGNVCSINTDTTNIYNTVNAKADSTTETAATYYVDPTLIDTSKLFTADDNCSLIGVDETAVWKGKAGSNDALETPFANLASEITGNVTLTADKVHGIDGKVNVKPGAVLTIEPGTTIAGVTPSSYLIIEAGAQIIADGTIDAPIVFTSKKDVDGYSTDNAAGEWGGLVIAGNAYTHYGVAKYEADETVEFGCDDGVTVACDNTQNSGTLNYVVLKHTGYEVEKDKELNGLSLAGVGSGTTISNVAIIGGLDDGLEIWGGRVNIDGLYVYNAQDDSVDTDLGYRGTIQNVLVQQVNVDKTNAFDSSTMEFGNDNNTITTDDGNATQPTIINATAYVKGGGFYTKNDAGANLDNVKFVSAKTLDVALHTFRTSDAYLTAAINALGDVCSINTDVTNIYNAVNAKADSTTETAATYYTDATLIDTTKLKTANDNCDAIGVDETTVWKGSVGSNDALETPPAP